MIRIGRGRGRREDGDGGVCEEVVEVVGAVKAWRCLVAWGLVRCVRSGLCCSRRLGCRASGCTKRSAARWFQVNVP